jgi:hypothetical protein
MLVAPDIEPMSMAMQKETNANAAHISVQTVEVSLASTIADRSLATTGDRETVAHLRRKR